MKDYFRETEFVLDKLQFDYLGGRYQGRGIMTWKPEQGFHIEAPLDLQNMPRPRDVEFGRVGVIRKSDRSSIRIFLSKSYSRAIAPSVTFVNRFDVISEKRISINLSRVIFSRYHSRELTKYSLTGSALYETKGISSLLDGVSYEKKLEIQDYEVFNVSKLNHKGIYFKGEKGQIIYGYMLDDEYLEIFWELPKERFSRNYSWQLPEAIRYSLSIILGQELNLLQRTVYFGKRERTEIKQKQPINSLNLLSLVNGRSELNKEYFIGLTNFIADNEVGSDICRNIFQQLIEASRQKNWQVRELLVATVLEAALRNIDNEPFQPKSNSWKVGKSLERFIEQYLSNEWKGIKKSVMQAHTYLRDRNAHPDWLFTQGGALSEEELERSLDNMIFLSRFYGYMILALAGIKNLKPHFPKPHSEWQSPLVIAPANLNRKTKALETHQIQQPSNSWQSLLDSLDRFSDDFMETREQPQLQVRENLFE